MLLIQLLARFSVKLTILVTFTLVDKRNSLYILSDYCIVIHERPLHNQMYTISALFPYPFRFDGCALTHKSSLYALSERVHDVYRRRR